LVEQLIERQKGNTGDEQVSESRDLHVMDGMSTDGSDRCLCWVSALIIGARVSI
jgi:hypothetical protein